MRVTNQMTTNNFISNINKHSSQLARYNNQLSSGKLITRPSDDPAATARTLLLQRNIDEADQYLKNLDSVKSWYDAADVALSHVGNILQRARELTVAGANGTLSTSAREAISEEMGQLKEQLLEAANAAHEGKFIFATHNLTEKPFGDDYVSNELLELKERHIEIAPNITLNLNNKGKTIFAHTEIVLDTTGNPVEVAVSLFDKIQEISDAISNGDVETVSNSLNDMDNYLDNFLKERVSIGAKTLRVENMSAKYQEEKLNLTNLLSKTSDTDIAETMISFKMQENVYQAALMSGNKLLNISLLDFMR